MSEAAAQRAVLPHVGAARLLSDDRLAARAKKGDERAFTAIFRRYHQSLYRYCLAIVGEPEDAQDALQSTMFKVLRALPGEKRHVELKPWLYRIAHNESIELLRRRRDVRELDADLAAPDSGLAEKASQRERLRELLSDLDQLPERQRGVLVMRELGGLGFAEIGAALGTSAAVARQTLYEARVGLGQMSEGREMSCDTVTRVLSDGDGRVTRRRDVRAHLRTCADCRRFREEIAGRRGDLAAISPLPAAAAVGLLHGLLGGSGGSAGGGLAGVLGAGAAKSVGASLALKSAATVAVVAAIGVTAADRSGLIHIGPGSAGETAAGRGEPAPASGAAATSPSRATAVDGAGSAGRNAASPAGVAVGQANASGRGTARVATPGSGAGGRAASAGRTRPSAGAAGSHPSGRGHAKAHPAAAAKGQATATVRKSSQHGSGKAPSQGNAPKPASPVHSSTPGSSGSASPPPPSSSAEPHSSAPSPPLGGGAPAPEAEAGGRR